MCMCDFVKDAPLSMCGFLSMRTAPTLVIGQGQKIWSSMLLSDRLGGWNELLQFFFRVDG